MNVALAHSPAFLADGSIVLMVQFDGFPGELPFNAIETDSTDHGQDIFTRAKSGEFGPVAPYVPPVETPDQVVTRLSNIVQRHMDSAAQARGYDSILSAVTYASEPSVPAYQIDGQAFRSWRSLVWQKCLDVMAAVKSGARATPTEVELLGELPSPPSS